ncbi:PIN domain-containing protein, partial [Sulfolobus sp. E5]
MEKRLLNHSELIVDTSFLLPFVGIKVKGIDERLLEGKRIYYPSLMLTEL